MFVWQEYGIEQQYGIMYGKWNAEKPHKHWII